MCCSKTAVHTAIRTFENEGSYLDKTRTGQPRKTTKRDYTMMKIIVSRSPTSSCKKVEAFFVLKGWEVLLTTSAGEIEVELWSKEAPLACRNFVQLCLEGYYDSTVFHRVIPGFIAQGGDPLGTGEGGESIYGKPFKDEFHSRLRFVRRGLVAMANSRPNDNGSQFFFTLGQCIELHNKHTIFGKVAGDTLYNLPRFEEGEINKDERPMYPQKVIKTEVLVNPFTDIVPREAIANEISKEDRKKKKKKGVKNFSLLSFGGEAEEEEALVISATREMGGAGGTEPSLLDPEETEVIPPPEREGAKERIRAKLMKLTAPDAKDNVSVKFKNKENKKDPESAPDILGDTSPAKTDDAADDKKDESVASSSSTVDKTVKSAGHDSSLHRRHHSDSHHSHHHKKDKKKRDRSEEKDGRSDRRREKKRRESKEEEAEGESKDKKRRGSKEEETDNEVKDKKRRGSKEEEANGESKDKKKKGSKEEEASGGSKDKKRRGSKEEEGNDESKNKKRRGSKEEEASCESKDKKRRGSKEEETDNEDKDKNRKGSKEEGLDDKGGHDVKKDNRNIGKDIKESSLIDDKKSVAKEDGNGLGKDTISDGKVVVDKIGKTSSNNKKDKDASSRKQEDAGELDKSEDKNSSGKRRRTSSDAAARDGVNGEEKKRQRENDSEERVSHKNGEKSRTSQDDTASAVSLKIDDADEKKENVQKLSPEEEAKLEKAKKLSEMRAEIRQLKREFTGKDGKKKNKNKEKEENGKEVNKDEKPASALQEYQIQKEKYLDKKRSIPEKGTKREDITLALMEKFNSKVKSALTEAEEKREKDGLEEEKGDEDEDEDDWLRHRLVYDTDAPVLARDASTKDDTWYPLDDPRHPLNRQRREEAGGGGGGGGKGGAKRGKK